MNAQIATTARLIIPECLGQGASRTIEQLILSNPQILKVTFASYSHLPLIQERAKPSKFEKGLIKDALALRSNFHLPFWDCIMLLISNSEISAPTLLEKATTHISLRDSYTVLDTTAIKDNAIQELVMRNALNNLETCVTSEVVMADGSTRHLAMMDFHCRPSTAGRLAAKSVCKKLFPSGALLLESGESFHAYGLKLLSESQFYEFLGRALLFAPIVDRAYIAHQLIEQRCALRISGVVKPTPQTLSLIRDENETVKDSR